LTVGRVSRHFALEPSVTRFFVYAELPNFPIREKVPLSRGIDGGVPPGFMTALDSFQI
jgi:hypothetical protein